MEKITLRAVGPLDLPRHAPKASWVSQARWVLYLPQWADPQHNPEGLTVYYKHHKAAMCRMRNQIRRAKNA